MDTVDRAAALKAIAEFDALGRDAFLTKYGFGRSTRLYVRHSGMRYDIKALAGAARGFAQPDAGPAKATEFSSGKPVVDLFRRLGFEVDDKTDQSHMESAREFRNALEQVLAGYLDGKAMKLGANAPMYKAIKAAERSLQALVSDYPHIKVNASPGKGNWAEVPWIALLDNRLTDTTRRGVYCVYLFRADMTGVYSTLNQGVTELREKLKGAGARRQLQQTATEIRSAHGEKLSPTYTPADGIDLRASGGLGNDYEQGTIAWRFYARDAVPAEEELLSDLYKLLDAYDEYVSGAEPAPPALTTNVDHSMPTSTTALIAALGARSYTFEPWQVATFVHALRTKPFVILAGISGTGKSRLPALIGELTGARVEMIPVRPDWTDSADLIGYTNLQGAFVPGRLLAIAKEASANPAETYFVILDEMNLARVEQYFAEVLSLIEDRVRDDNGWFESRGVLAPAAGPPWSSVRLPANLAIIGTVNMDETTHGFSRKVLDRAFTIEMSEIDLTGWQNTNSTPPTPVVWSAARWRPRAMRPGEIESIGVDDQNAMESAVSAIQEMNRILAPAQLQVGYRVRDEIGMFLIHSREEPAAFVTRDGASVAALDLAINMKILPRIQGGSSTLRIVLRQLISWANDNTAAENDDDVRAVVDSWVDAERPFALSGARFPRTTARLSLMWERLQSEGFTSYWL